MNVTASQRSNDALDFIDCEVSDITPRVYEWSKAMPFATPKLTSKNFSEGIYKPNEQIVIVEKCKDSLSYHHGTWIESVLHLELEEALFLMERQVLQVRCEKSDRLLRIPELYNIALSTLSADSYRVYSHLKRIGYHVFRSKARIKKVKPKLYALTPLETVKVSTVGELYTQLIDCADDLRSHRESLINTEYYNVDWDVYYPKQKFSRKGVTYPDLCLLVFSAKGNFPSYMTGAYEVVRPCSPEMADEDLENKDENKNNKRRKIDEEDTEGKDFSVESCGQEQISLASVDGGNILFFLAGNEVPSLVL